MSPVVLPPVSTAYCSLSRAPPPVSVMYQPVGSVVFVVLPAVFESVLNVSVGMSASSVVSEMLPVPVSAATRETIKADGTSTKAAMMIGSSMRRTELVLLPVKGKVDTGLDSFLGLMLYSGQRSTLWRDARGQRLRR